MTFTVTISLISNIDLTSETLTWDRSMTLYEEQENRMTDHSSAIVRDAAVRGPDLVIRPGLYSDPPIKR